MTFEVECHCLRNFPVRDEFAGGIVNCPHCGKAVEVPGLRDPYWRVLQIGAAILWAGVTAAAYFGAGSVAAAITAVMLGGAIWLISRLL